MFQFADQKPIVKKNSEHTVNGLIATDLVNHNRINLQYEIMD